MKKIVKLTESDIIQLVKKILAEQVVQGIGSDPYEYKKEGDKYFARKKGANKWILAKGEPERAIKTKIFKDTSKVAPKTTPTTQKVDTRFSQNNFKDSDTRYQRDTYQGYRDTNVKNIEYTKFKLAPYIKLFGKITDRGFQQLIKVTSNPQFKTISFIIVDKSAAIAALFGPDYKYLGKSSITSGFVKDTGSKEDELSYQKWFQFSKDYAIKNPSSSDGKKIKAFADKLKIDIKNLDYNKHRQGFPYSYPVLKEKGYAKTPSGTYKLGASHSVKGYAGSGNNTFPLVNVDTGEKLPSAVHGAAGKNRDELIKKASSQEINTDKDFSRAGSGCVNVDANFISLIQKYNPQYVIILPDTGNLAELPKAVPIETWTEKILGIGNRCVSSLFNLFK
jgi:hypothetical protein